MELEAARDFVREHHRAVLATHRSDGRPQMSVLMAGVDESGRFVMSSRETAMKTLNARRDPQVSLLVFTDEFFGPWVQVDGVAEVISLPDAMEPLVEYYRSIQGEHDDWDDYRRAMTEEQRVIIAVSATRAGPDRSG
jgi:PPOX class probable F420-dependent enzyme